MAEQRYVSPDLSHFVGRSLADDEARYQRLLAILGSGELRVSHPGPEITWSRPLFPEDAGRYKQGPVCFCDIPEPDLGIHVGKYGPFGLAFSKEFLIRHGARPVFYVAETAVWGTEGHTVRDRLNDLVESLGHLESEMYTPGSSLDQHHPLFEDLQNALRHLVEDELLRFVKGFDPTRLDEDPENYYMEREWRTNRGVPFVLDDVRRVFMPQRFAKCFRRDVREYRNQVSFVPERRSA